MDTTPWEEAAMRATLQRIAPRAVLVLIGTTKARARRAARRGQAVPTYGSVDRDLTVLLARAAAGSQARPRLVYLSSLGADPGSRNPYLRARGEAEEAVRRSGLPWIIARPSFITGPDREESRLAERMGAAALDAALRLASLVGGHRLRARYRSIRAGSLAEALVRLAVAPEGTGRVVEAEELR